MPRPARYHPLEEPHTGLSLRATHRVQTADHPPCYALTEAGALHTASVRLPQPSAVEILHRHASTREESWEFWRVFP